MNSNFSKQVADVVMTLSKKEANRLSNNYIGPEHLLLGLIRDGQGKAIHILRSLDVDIESVKEGLERILGRYKNDMLLPNADVPLSDEAFKIIRMCVLEARAQQSKMVDTEHLLLAILRENDNLAAKMLEKDNIDYTKVYELLKVTPDTTAGMDIPAEDDDEEVTPPQGGGGNPFGRRAQTKASTTTGKSANDTPVLDNFGVDMTAAAASGTLDPVVGREREIERVAQILSRRKKNNPVLIGDPGVGKSAIVEGLALRIVEKKVSRILFDKRVISLDLAAVVAGTKYRGQFEERIQSILAELRKNPQIILFIDEIHTIVGAGSAAGSMDAANMLKPALSRGEIQCIGATTLDEYRNNIEKDGALERRFQKILVEPTTKKETLEILRNIKERYEDHHNVTYTDGALEACVSLTDRYINDRYFPDKAIDALDESGARIHLNNINVPKEIEEEEAKLEELKVKKTDSVKLQNFELAASYRDQEKKVEANLEKMKKEWESEMKENRETVTEEDIEQVVSMISGVPVHRMAHAEGEKLVALRDILKGKVIAQDKAVDQVSKAILRSRVGLKDPNSPTGTFMFLGPTGVGKTYLAQELAREMFGSTEALIRVDMTEYMEKHSVSKLVGSAPGYVGYEDGGQLTEQVRRRPYSIVLLDEIEKAHQDVFNILLQVMDEGRLTDSNGRLVDFKNTIIIMTSNVGSRRLKEFGRGVGFTRNADMNDTKFAASVIKKELGKTFAPEFINRIDEVITFDPLDIDAIIRIVDLELDKLVKRVQEIGYTLELTDDAKRFLAESGYDVQFGARPLKRSIQSHLEDGLSELIIANKVKEGNHIIASLNKEKKELTFEIKADKKEE